MPELAVAVAGIPGSWSSEALSASLRSLGADSFVVPLWECAHDLSNGRVTWEGMELTRLDGMVVKKLGDAASPHSEGRLVLLQQLEQSGVLVISNSRSIQAAVNRYSMTLALRRAGIPMPRTLITESLDEAESTVQMWGKAVIKPLFTSKGRGMTLLTSNTTTRLRLRHWQREGRGPFYLQEFVPAPGRDLAVAVLKDRILGAYYRVAAPSQWMTTTTSGGHYERCALSATAASIALAAATVFGLDFTSVDMVETDAGWLVYEVSAFGGFSGLHKTHGIDAAYVYAEHALKRLRDERG